MTNVPGPTFGTTGFIVAEQSAILAGVQEDWNAAFQTAFDFSTTGGASTNATPQGQITASEAAIVGNVQEQFVFLTNQFDPAYATGRYQDALARIYFLTRIPAQPTVLQIACNGLSGVVIPEGAQISDTSGNVYLCTAEATIPGGGSVTTSFAALVPGPIAIPGTSAVSIYQTIAGWDSVSVVSGVLGNDTESRSAFETRRIESVAANSVGSLSSILGAVLGVEGVADAYVTENDSGAPVTTGGFTLAAKSVYVAASGGDDDDVARAAWSKKAPGCAWNGNTSVTVTDDNEAYSDPKPSYTVLFERPAELEILFAVSILNSSSVPTTATTQIQDAIVAAFAGSDGGPRARIGSTVLASRFYAPIAVLGSWAQILSVQIGSNNTKVASITGSIVGSTLTVTAVASGTITAGKTVSGTGGANGTGIPEGTRIVAQLSGTTGLTGTYSLTLAGSAVSGPLFVATADQTSVSVGIAQVPEIDPGNIVVTYT